MHLGGGVLTLAGIAGCLVLAGAVWLGAQFAGPAASPDPRPDLYASAMRLEVEKLQHRMRNVSGAARHDLDALALRLSELQATAIRVDALGERLVQLAGLDPEEFSFGEPPPRGGSAPTGDVEPFGVKDFVGGLAELERVLDLRVQELQALENTLLTGRLARQAHPSGAPVDRGWLSSAFGSRIDPLTGQRSRHLGLDFAGKRGSPIASVASGIVTFSGTRTGLGRIVEIDHGNGYMTRYAHNSKNLAVAGQRISKGQFIARIGSSGRSTGNHVHFEVLHHGKHLNPMKFINEARKSP
jgi:murein DD-endopeptidase MepM/ murein hydrolase activator NlpD